MTELDREFLELLAGRWKLQSWKSSKFTHLPNAWKEAHVVGRMDVLQRETETFLYKFTDKENYSIVENPFSSALFSEWFSHTIDGTFNLQYFKHLFFEFEIISAEYSSWKRLKFIQNNEVRKEGYWDFTSGSYEHELDTSEWSFLSFHNSDVQLHPMIRKLASNEIELVEHFEAGDCETHVHNLRLIKLYIGLGPSIYPSDIGHQTSSP